MDAVPASNPIKVKEDFCEFITIPVAARKSISANFSSSLGLPLQKISTSSTKSRCVIMRYGEVFIPWKSPELMADINAMINPSATRRNNRGERGHPCLRPLSEKKKGEAALLIRTTNVTVDMQTIIHLMKGTSNPRCVSSSVMKDQLTRSKAFERSIFSTTPLD